MTISPEFTEDERREILARLQPHLPANLTSVEVTPFGQLLCDFAPFTGAEREPLAPSTESDPKLRYVAPEDDEAEYRLRQRAAGILIDLYETAREAWRGAAYVAGLVRVVVDTPARWQAYQDALTDLDAAYAYLRTSKAAGEWRPAVSRLIDAQDRVKAAAARFDERAQLIAGVHDRYVHAGLSSIEALTAAGYLQAGDWPIVQRGQYSRRGFGVWEDEEALPLGERVQRLIERQEAHIAKVARLVAPTG